MIPRDPDGHASAADIVLADNRFPQFVRPICEAARRRDLRVVLDADKTTAPDDPLFGIATLVIFSAECLSATTGLLDRAEALRAVARHTGAFLAVSDGPNDILFIAAGVVRPMPVFRVRAVDTLAAGDALHGGFALALAEGAEEAAALRFGAAVAGVKCTRIGGAGGMPRRAEVAPGELAGGAPSSKPARARWAWRANAAKARGGPFFRAGDTSCSENIFLCKA